jgi:lipopolysaccharide transport system permease protein
MSSVPDSALPVVNVSADLWLIEPRQHGVVDKLRELWRYRYLWWYFAADALKAMYRRTKLGWIWLAIRVTAPVSISALIFGGLLGVASNGPPYFLFFSCGMTTWILFERSLLVVTRSLERNRKLITKVYFPRLILPLSAVAPGLLYLAILLIVIIGTVIYYRRQEGVWYITLRPELLVAVVSILLTLVFTVSVGLWTSVLQARYPDIRQGIRYFMPFWMYFTPIIYPVTIIPEQWRWLMALNPMATIVELFKWGALGYGHLNPTSIAISLAMIVLTMISGIWFFNREESTSIDRL